MNIKSYIEDARTSIILSKKKIERERAKHTVAVSFH